MHRKFIKNIKRKYCFLTPGTECSGGKYHRSKAANTKYIRMKLTGSRLARFLPFAIWITVVFILLTLPAKDFGSVEIRIPNFDKLVHAGLFGGVVFLYGFAVINIEKSRTKASTIIITVIACVYGCAMEYVQRDCLHPPRDFSYGDMAADATGAVIGYFVIRWITSKYQGRRLGKNAC